MPQVSEVGNSRSSLVLFEAPQLLMSYCKLHFVEEKAKVNADYYVTNLIPKLVEDAIALTPDGFILQQDVVRAHTA